MNLMLDPMPINTGKEFVNMDIQDGQDIGLKYKKITKGGNLIEALKYYPLQFNGLDC